MGNTIQSSNVLVLDSRILSDTKNTRIQVSAAEKEETNPLFGEDTPWEQRQTTNYVEPPIDIREMVIGYALPGDQSV